MKRCFLLILMVVAFTGCNRNDGSGFITVENGRFMNGSSPYYFIGVNYWYGAIIGSQGQHGDRQRLLRELDHMKGIGVDNLRILVGAEGPDGEPFRVTPTLQTSPGVYSDTLLDGLDFLLSEMGKRGQRAILFLNNSWEWSGGYSQYVSWNTNEPIPYPSATPNDWPKFMEFSGRFHSCEPCIEQFHEFIRFIIGRTNRYTGVKYTDDPAIMTWEVGNEPRAFSNENIPAMKEMIAGVAALIKQLDKNHLVTTGTEGRHGCEQSMELFEQIHADPNIDYMVMHIWPKNWGWLNIRDIASSMDVTINNTNAYMNDHFEVSRRLNKPVVLEEFGLPRDHHGYNPSETTVNRDAFYANAFDQITEHAKKKDVLAGCNIWAYAGEGRPPVDHVFWQPGDDYLGDPPQEEQGLNSVFDTDSTIDLIKEYNNKLKKIK